MLSYRHAFHAGNHADVLKHYILLETLAYFTKKDKPFWYIDTHAGAGLYSLKNGFATKNLEYETGISKLWRAKDLPAELVNYVGLIRTINRVSNLSSPELEFYPGSPICAKHVLRPSDKMRLFELHPSDADILSQHFDRSSRQVQIEQTDGFKAIKAILPPPTRRAVILIDPPYEDKQDYIKVLQCIEDCLERFATGTYLIWYPLLKRPEPSEMVQKLKALVVNDWMNVTLTITKPGPDGFGMYGSGLFIINPPWTLPNTLERVLPALKNLLAESSQSGFSVEAHLS
jgi:23S rRNA (adenine2030-N6)-methyltransferase